VLELIDEGIAVKGQYDDNNYIKETYEIEVKELTLKGESSYQTRE
jgi:hypothetical protein